MWGLGASIGPYVMAWALTGGQSWRMGYRYVGILQILLTAILFFSFSLWKRRPGQGTEEEDRALRMGEILSIPGAKEVMCTFFGYCALEQTAALWGSSYLVLHLGMDAERAAGFGCLFFVGITVGRFLSGFVTMKVCDRDMIRMGSAVIFLGILALLVPLGENGALVGLLLIGFGCAPVYPCVIHATPAHFGAERSQAVIGVQMASAYVGTCLAPPVFGFLAQRIGAGLMPWYLLIILVMMAGMHERMLKKVTE
jgi:fucose permease